MGTQRTAMLVDDCSIDNYVNRKIILNYKFAETVAVFQSPVKALAHLSKMDEGGPGMERIPDILFLDLNMPLLDGKEFMTHYMNLSPRITGHCRVVILSGTIDPVEMNVIRNIPQVITLIRKPLIKQNLDLLEHLLKPGFHIPDNIATNAMFFAK